MKHLITILFSAILFLQTDAQTTKDLLSNKDWCIEKTNGYYAGLRFEGNEVISFMELNGRHEKRNPYYFSETKESVFDNSKIGKASTGKYLILRGRQKNLQTNEWEIYALPLKINKITETRLELITPVTGTVIVHYAK